MDGRGKLGRRGEDLACLYLMERGHSILERNWRAGHLEIDLITLAADGLHFVEVKSLSAPAALRPEERVDAAKQRRIARAASAYLNRSGHPALGDLECSFDVIAVLFNGEITDIQWIPQAYIPLLT